MVEILCPHCEEEIELDDDAKGEFGCPYCDGEFEWGMDDDDVSFSDEIVPRNDILHEYPENPALRITVGVITAVVMGLHILASIFIIFGGIFVGEIEGAINDATDTESSIGAMIILSGLIMLILFTAGTHFAIQMAKGRFFGLIVCSILSGIMLPWTIISWALDDTEVCTIWVDDGFMESCVEYGSPGFPIFGTLMWMAILGMLCAMIFVPKFRYQFD